MSTDVVPEVEARNFPRGQGSQRVVRKRTHCTLHKKPGRLTPRSRKRAVSGRERVRGVRMHGYINPLIYLNISREATAAWETAVVTIFRGHVVTSPIAYIPSIFVLPRLSTIM